MEQKFIEIRGAREHNLKGVDMDIPRDSLVVITGLSGSGKSSLLMLMGGLERATGGEVMALGQDLTAMDEDGFRSWVEPIGRRLEERTTLYGRPARV